MNQVFSLLRRLGLLPEEELASRRSTISKDLSVKAASSQNVQPKPPEVKPEATEPQRQQAARRNTGLAYQTLFLQELVRGLLSRRDSRMAEILESPEKRISAEDRDEETRKMMTRLSSIVKSFALEFNSLSYDIPGFERMRLSIGDLADVKEQGAEKPYGVSKGSKSKSAKNLTYIRFRISTQSWCLSLRGNRGRIEFFIVPATELFLLSQSETPVRLRSAITLNERLGKELWTLDGLPAEPDELYFVSRQLFKNLLYASAQDLKEELDTSSVLQALEGDALKTTVRELLLAEQNMAQKIVSQQEEIQNRIARDLHDAVIADLMALKRALGEDTQTPETVSVALDSISQKIREICHDLTPRDLRDWGLQTVVEDLLERVAQRTGADCSFECDGELPEFPFPVQLHLFRIIQECLNNMEKYAGASRILVRFSVANQIVRLTMSDDGKGYEATQLEARRALEGGTGLSGLRERAEMIRCFYPTRLRFESTPGSGTVTSLEMRLMENA